MQLPPLADALILGVVEGITEFLPVSSTGHLILVSDWLGANDEKGKVFDIVIQLGAILAICLLYYAKIFATIGGVVRREPTSIRFATAVIVAFLPAAVIGVVLHKYIKLMLDTPIVVPIAFIVGGIAILIIERYAPRPRVKSVDDIDWKTALFVGFCQCLAMIPGVSRSGATIMGARVLRVDRATSAEFSFFLAIPTMLGASVYDTYKNWKTLDWQGGGLIAVGFVVAFLSALVVVKPFVRFISRHGFGVFAWYRIVVGILAIALLLMH